MKYSELKALLNDMTESELNQNVIVMDMNSEEFIPVYTAVREYDSDVLDPGHFIIVAG